MARLIPLMLLVTAACGTGTTDDVRVVRTDATAVRFLNDTHVVTGIATIEKIQGGKKTQFEQWFTAKVDDSAVTERGSGDLSPITGNLDTKERGQFLDKGAVALIRASVSETKVLGLPCGAEYFPIGAVGGDTTALAFPACDTDDRARAVFIPADPTNIVAQDLGVGRPLLMAGSNNYYAVFIARVERQDLFLYTKNGDLRANAQLGRSEAVLATVSDDGTIFAIVRDTDTSLLTLRSYSPLLAETVLGTILENPAPLALTVGSAGVYVLTSAGYVLRFAKVGGLLSEWYLEDGADPTAMSVRPSGAVDVAGRLSARSVVVWTLDTTGNVTTRKELDPLQLSVKAN